MDIGLALPHMGQTSPALITRLAQEAEQIGYTSLWAGERLLRPKAYRPFGYPPGPMPDYFTCVYDPLETLAFVAGQTQRIKLGTSVIVAGFHAPVVLARQFATLDQLSGGRVIAGLGQGWLKDEFDATNTSFASRGNFFEEYIEVMRAVWGPDPVSYTGRSYQIGEADSGPKPRQPGGPPLLLGVGAKASLERAARVGDGLNPIAVSWKQLAWLAREFPLLVQKAGRDPKRMLTVVRANSRISTHSLSKARPPFCGDLQQIKEDVHRLEDLGFQQLFFDLAFHPGEQQAELLAQLWDTLH